MTQAELLAKPYVLSIEQAISQSSKLVYEGQGQTAWLRLSKDERIQFHAKRKKELIHLFPSGEIAQIWEGTFIKAKRGRSCKIVGVFDKNGSLLVRIKI